MEESKMVFAIFLLALIVFLTVDYFLRREEKHESHKEKQTKKSLFLEKESVLSPIGNDEEKYYHPSHSWVLFGSDVAYVGYDNFTADLFSPKLNINVDVELGNEIEQGKAIWEIGQGNKTISQCSPISGKVISINPNCQNNSNLEAKDASKSWLLKIKPTNLQRDLKNLFNFNHSKMLNDKILEDLIGYTQGAYLNDGGELIDNFVETLSDEDWKIIKEKYFQQ